MLKIPLISIVDDDDALRSSLENLMLSTGLRAQGFSSAEEFLRSNQVHDTGCLILDVRLRSMNGLELQSEMIAAGSHVPIIFITAHEDDGRRRRALEAGALAFLYKPFFEGELLSAINAAFKDS
jgi:FixJ family two-component response regulator